MFLNYTLNLLLKKGVKKSCFLGGSNYFKTAV